MKSETRNLFLTEAVILIMIFTGTFPTWASVTILLLLLVQFALLSKSILKKWKERNT